MTVRIGAAGVAGMGMFHVTHFPKLEGAELTAICDAWPRALEGAAGLAPDAKRPWRGTWKECGGGVLLMQAVHQLDSFLWIAGTPSRVTARAWRSRADVQVEDDVYAVLEFPDGAHGMLSASTLDPAGLNRLE